MFIVPQGFPQNNMFTCFFFFLNGKFTGSKKNTHRGGSSIARQILSCPLLALACRWTCSAVSLGFQCGFSYLVSFPSKKVPKLSGF